MKEAAKKDIKPAKKGLKAFPEEGRTPLQGVSSGCVAPKKVSLLRLATTFTKIGMFTLGGGYAMIPLIDREVVEKRKWLQKDEFYDILGIAQSAPGLLIVNISIFVGYRLRGRRGSVAATIGSCLPSFLIILAIAIFFAGYRNNVYVDKIFKGIRPVVVALIAVPVVDMIKRSHLNIWRALLAAGTAAAIIFLKVSPIYILLVVFTCFFCARYFERRRAKNESEVAKGDEGNGKVERYDKTEENETVEECDGTEGCEEIERSERNDEAKGDERNGKVVRYKVIEENEKIEECEVVKGCEEMKVEGSEGSEGAEECDGTEGCEGTEGSDRVKEKEGGV